MSQTRNYGLSAVGQTPSGIGRMGDASPSLRPGKGPAHWLAPALARRCARPGARRNGSPRGRP